MRQGPRDKAGNAYGKGFKLEMLVAKRQQGRGGNVKSSSGKTPSTVQTPVFRTGELEPPSEESTPRPLHQAPLDVGHMVADLASTEVCQTLTEKALQKVQDFHAALGGPDEDEILHRDTRTSPPQISASLWDRQHSASTMRTGTRQRLPSASTQRSLFSRQPTCQSTGSPTKFSRGPGSARSRMSAGWASTYTGPQWTASEFGSTINTTMRSAPKDDRRCVVCEPPRDYSPRQNSSIPWVGAPLSQLKGDGDWWFMSAKDVGQSEVVNGIRYNPVQWTRFLGKVKGGRSKDGPMKLGPPPGSKLDMAGMLPSQFIGTTLGHLGKFAMSDVDRKFFDSEAMATLIKRLADHRVEAELAVFKSGCVINAATKQQQTDMTFLFALQWMFQEVDAQFDTWSSSDDSDDDSSDYDSSSSQYTTSDEDFAPASPDATITMALAAKKAARRARGRLNDKEAKAIARWNRHEDLRRHVKELPGTGQKNYIHAKVEGVDGDTDSDMDATMDLDAMDGAMDGEANAPRKKSLRVRVDDLAEEHEGDEDKYPASQGRIRRNRRKKEKQKRRRERERKREQQIAISPKSTKGTGGPSSAKIGASPTSPKGKTNRFKAPKPGPKRDTEQDHVSMNRIIRDAGDWVKMIKHLGKGQNLQTSMEKKKMVLKLALVKNEVLNILQDHQDNMKEIKEEADDKIVEIEENFQEHLADQKRSREPRTPASMLMKEELGVGDPGQQALSCDTYPLPTMHDSGARIDYTNGAMGEGAHIPVPNPSNLDAVASSNFNKLLRIWKGTSKPDEVVDEFKDVEEDPEDSPHGSPKDVCKETLAGKIQHSIQKVALHKMFTLVTETHEAGQLPRDRPETMAQLLQWSREAGVMDWPCIRMGMLGLRTFEQYLQYTPPNWDEVLRAVGLEKSRVDRLHKIEVCRYMLTQLPIGEKNIDIEMLNDISQAMTEAGITNPIKDELAERCGAFVSYRPAIDYIQGTLEYLESIESNTNYEERLYQSAVRIQSKWKGIMQRRSLEQWKQMIQQLKERKTAIQTIKVTVREFIRLGKFRLHVGKLRIVVCKIQRAIRYYQARKNRIKTQHVVFDKNGKRKKKRKDQELGLSFIWKQPARTTILRFAFYDIVDQVLGFIQTRKESVDRVLVFDRWISETHVDNYLSPRLLTPGPGSPVSPDQKRGSVNLEERMRIMKLKVRTAARIRRLSQRPDGESTDSSPSSTTNPTLKEILAGIAAENQSKGSDDPEFRKRALSKFAREKALLMEQRCKNRNSKEENLPGIAIEGLDEDADIEDSDEEYDSDAGESRRPSRSKRDKDVGKYLKRRISRVTRDSKTSRHRDVGGDGQGDTGQGSEKGVDSAREQLGSEGPTSARPIEGPQKEGPNTIDASTFKFGETENLSRRPNEGPQGVGAGAFGALRRKSKAESRGSKVKKRSKSTKSLDSKKGKGRKKSIMSGENAGLKHQRPERQPNTESGKTKAATPSPDPSTSAKKPPAAPTHLGTEPNEPTSRDAKPSMSSQKSKFRNRLQDMEGVYRPESEPGTGLEDGGMEDTESEDREAEDREAEDREAEDREAEDREPREKRAADGKAEDAEADEAKTEDSGKTTSLSSTSGSSAYNAAPAQGMSRVATAKKNILNLALDIARVQGKKRRANSSSEFGKAALTPWTADTVEEAPAINIPMKISQVIEMEKNGKHFSPRIKAAVKALMSLKTGNAEHTTDEPSSPEPAPAGVHDAEWNRETAVWSFPSLGADSMSAEAIEEFVSALEEDTDLERNQSIVLKGIQSQSSIRHKRKEPEQKEEQYVAPVKATSIRLVINSESTEQDTSTQGHQQESSMLHALLHSTHRRVSQQPKEEGLATPQGVKKSPRTPLLILPSEDGGLNVPLVEAVSATRRSFSSDNKKTVKKFDLYDGCVPLTARAAQAQVPSAVKSSTQGSPKSYDSKNSNSPRSLGSTYSSSGSDFSDDEDLSQPTIEPRTAERAFRWALKARVQSIFSKGGEDDRLKALEMVREFGRASRYDTMRNLADVVGLVSWMNQQLGEHGEQKKKHMREMVANQKNIIRELEEQMLREKERDEAKLKATPAHISLAETSERNAILKEQLESWFAFNLQSLSLKRMKETKDINKPGKRRHTSAIDQITQSMSGENWQLLENLMRWELIQEEAESRGLIARALLVSIPAIENHARHICDTKNCNLKRTLLREVLIRSEIAIGEEEARTTQTRDFASGRKADWLVGVLDKGPRGLVPGLAPKVISVVKSLKSVASSLKLLYLVRKLIISAHSLPRQLLINIEINLENAEIMARDKIIVDSYSAFHGILHDLVSGRSDIRFMTQLMAKLDESLDVQDSSSFGRAVQENSSTASSQKSSFVSSKPGSRGRTPSSRLVSPRMGEKEKAVPIIVVNGRPSGKQDSNKLGRRISPVLDPQALLNASLKTAESDNSLKIGETNAEEIQPEESIKEHRRRSYLGAVQERAMLAEGHGIVNLVMENKEADMRDALILRELQSWFWIMRAHMMEQCARRASPDRTIQRRLVPLHYTVMSFKDPLVPPPPSGPWAPCVWEVRRVEKGEDREREAFKQEEDGEMQKMIQVWELLNVEYKIRRQMIKEEALIFSKAYYILATLTTGPVKDIGELAQQIRGESAKGSPLFLGLEDEAPFNTPASVAQSPVFPPPIPGEDYGSLHGDDQVEGDEHSQFGSTSNASLSQVELTVLHADSEKSKSPKVAKVPEHWRRESRIVQVEAILRSASGGTRGYADLKVGVMSWMDQMDRAETAVPPPPISIPPSRLGTPYLSPTSPLSLSPVSQSGRSPKKSFDPDRPKTTTLPPMATKRQERAQSPKPPVTIPKASHLFSTPPGKVLPQPNRMATSTSSPQMVSTPMDRTTLKRMASTPTPKLASSLTGQTKSSMMRRVPGLLGKKSKLKEHEAKIRGQTLDKIRSPPSGKRQKNADQEQQATGELPPLPKVPNISVTESRASDPMRSKGVLPRASHDATLDSMFNIGVNAMTSPIKSSDILVQIQRSSMA